jgi:glycosyltransferase involved in cell wall biosynthesis
MKVLQVVKTSDGAQWAALQAAELIRRGIEIHVALPKMDGAVVSEWRDAGAKIHLAALDFRTKSPWRLPATCEMARNLLDEIRPDLIHTHHVGTTLVLRHALGKNHAVPRVFQVPGPLHLEHSLFRKSELSASGNSDFWIASSKCILTHYEAAGIPASRLFLGYYGYRLWEHARQRTNVLRNMLGIGDKELVVGNINWMYAPKYYLGQRVGLKCHEDIIDALAIVTRKRRDVVGVLVGGAWSNATWYEKRLRARAKAAAGDRIKMTGVLPPDIVRPAWPDFDCAVHVPLSENCGGVLEPLVAGVPTIAGRVGGLPELVIEGVTGKTVNTRRPKELADTILEVLENLNYYRSLAATGQKIATMQFDLRRTSENVYRIYQEILNSHSGQHESLASAQLATLSTGTNSQHQAEDAAGAYR